MCLTSPTCHQSYELDEAAFRGERYKDYGRDLQGNNDLLSVTRPDIISDIHNKYLEGGACQAASASHRPPSPCAAASRLGHH